MLFDDYCGGIYLSFYLKTYLISPNLLNPIDGWNYFDRPSNTFRSRTMDSEYRKKDAKVKPKKKGQICFTIFHSRGWYLAGDVYSHQWIPKAMIWEQFKNLYFNLVLTDDIWRKQVKIQGKFRYVRM